MNRVAAPAENAAEPEIEINASFDFCKEVGPAGHAERDSPTLRRYHQRLWSKRLRNGRRLDLTVAGHYLHHKSELGEFWLSPDSIVHTYTNAYRKRMQPIIDQVPEHERQHFLAIACTIGAWLVFPANEVKGWMTVNGGRGLYPKIADRFDLTLECIRRHDPREWSPLARRLTCSPDFFDLFESFRGYVEVFLLQDLVSDHDGSIKPHMDFANFEASPLPCNLADYQNCRQRSVEFVQARNRRIEQAA